LENGAISLHFAIDELIEFFLPSSSDGNDLRERTYEKLARYLRHHNRNRGVQTDREADALVKVTLDAAREQANRWALKATADLYFQSSAQVLAWIVALADEHCTKDRDARDAELRASYLGEQRPRFAQKLLASLTAANGNPIDLAKFDALANCIGSAVNDWLAGPRKAERAAALGMYLRFEFGELPQGKRQSLLQRLYARPSPAAVAQRNLETRNTLRTLAQSCLERYGNENGNEQN
jgi:hypothetical protein